MDSTTRLATKLSASVSLCRLTMGQHDRGADDGDGEEDLAECAQPDARVGPVTEDVVGVVEDWAVEDQPCDRGDEGQGEQHTEDACALLVLPRRRWHTGS
jgi:hypothetical protein